MPEKMAAKEETQLLQGLKTYWTDRTHSYSLQNLEEMNDWRAQAWRDTILAHAPKKRVLRILDVGCGPGFFSITLAKAGHVVTAVDVTEHMLRHAQENAKAYDVSVHFLLHRAEQLPFADESFDLVVSRNVLWNLEDPQQALAEWARVLVPGGRMVYFDANWYLYLYDDRLRQKREDTRRAFFAKHPGHTGSGDLGPERVRELEQMAFSLPLSKEHRPEWDVQVLKGAGMRVLEADLSAGASLQDPLEFERDEATPLFMVCAEKEGIVSEGK